MWGADWTRTIGMLTYEQGVAPFPDTKRLSATNNSDAFAFYAGDIRVERPHPFRLSSGDLGTRRCSR